MSSWPTNETKFGSTRSGSSFCVQIADMPSVAKNRDEKRQASHTYLFADTIEFNSTDVSCFGGSDGTATALVIGTNGPYTYLWENDQETQTATDLAAGVHTVTVTDAGGCVTVAEVEINEPTALELVMSGSRF